MARSKKANTNSGNTATNGKTQKTQSTKPAKKKETVNFDNKSMTIFENGTERNIPLNNKQIAELLYGNKFLLKGKNKKQKELLSEIGLKEITIAVGPAGVGKSYVSVAKALELLANPDNNYQKIYVVTPNVEVDGSEIGFLPGNVEEKLSPYLFSTYYLMDKVIGKANRKRLQELNIVEPLAIGFLRGVNIDNAVLICEEAQNLTTLQMKTLVTRIGFNSKFIISGDLEQAERKIGSQNGLEDILQRFKNFDKIGKVIFEKEDVVRNPLITEMLKMY